jgi:hypothetical protein
MPIRLDIGELQKRLPLEQFLQDSTIPQTSRRGLFSIQNAPKNVPNRVREFGLAGKSRPIPVEP